ncbi:radical SAM protein [Geotalea uraniireducens]|uniref:Radical SAM domain protein n=1 Tax=Geotalea uraniireducens (strain Rf4) TaxID=351605 RepID=A5G750_GEOUR|nr:radical SAM protein [Geotalea uraniireducens]ABQ27618.1 Radical SAM domain protein [Geotalea uraniireducens Rf4]
MIVFGPVPSRRLGRSLGINNITPKVCTYSCVYCQVGRTIKTQVDRRAFYWPEEIAAEVENKVRVARENGEQIDYLTFVADGEPTLDINLAREIELLRPLGIRIAVITNASLIWRSDVAEALRKANWVSLKVDTVREDVWRKLNRPSPLLEFMDLLTGMIGFAKRYGGELATETMLVKGLNDAEEHLELLADFLMALKPAKAYLAIPTRPPAELWVKPPSEETVNRAFQILRRKVERVELLTGYEENAFACMGDVAEDLLAITAVHPMREEAVRELLAKAGGDWAVVKKLIDSGLLAETEYEGRKYYLQRFGKA